MKKLLLVLAVVAMASFLLVGCLPTSNTAPVITTTALPNATVEVAYTATVVATDTDDDALTFSLVSFPTDMVISEAGVISGWTPTAVGTQLVTVAVTDGTDSVSADFTITIDAAPVTPVAPTITAIPDQEVFWDEDGWTYQVIATLGTGTTLTYSLTGNPVSMSISSTGLITWTTILDMIALHEVTVKVVDNDGLFAEETFVIEVKEPVVPIVPPLTATIVYEADHFYDDGTTKYVRGGSGDDCVGVTVTLSEAVEEGDKVQIGWDDGEIANINWITLTGDTANQVFTGSLCFDGEGIEECELVCVEVQLVTPDLFCPACEGITTLIHSEMVKVDLTAPVVDLNIIFDSCTEGMCPPVSSISFTFEPDITGDICDPEPCCEEDCSGIAFWSIEDITDPCDYCPPLTGPGCPEGEYVCGCFLCSDSNTPVVYSLKFTFADNVGNEFVDTWTITVDSDCLVTAFTSLVDPEVPLVDGVYKLYDHCLPPALL